MTTIKLSEAKAHLGRYAHKAAQGHKFIIADRNKPVAVIGPAPQPDSGIRPKLGLMTGQATILMRRSTISKTTSTANKTSTARHPCIPLESVRTQQTHAQAGSSLRIGRGLLASQPDLRA
tara:strand:+ start:99 stop:458 length:360 start_codon:yes stop_codon:yes gene_type:complete